MQFLHTFTLQRFSVLALEPSERQRGAWFSQRERSLAELLSDHEWLFAHARAPPHYDTDSRLSYASYREAIIQQAEIDPRTIPTEDPPVSNVPPDVWGRRIFRAYAAARRAHRVDAEDVDADIAAGSVFVAPLAVSEQEQALDQIEAFTTHVMPMSDRQKSQEHWRAILAQPGLMETVQNILLTHVIMDWHAVILFPDMLLGLMQSLDAPAARPTVVGLALILCLVEWVTATEEHVRAGIWRSYADAADYAYWASQFKSGGARQAAVALMVQWHQAFAGHSPMTLAMAQGILQSALDHAATTTSREEEAYVLRAQLAEERRRAFIVARHGLRDLDARRLFAGRALTPDAHPTLVAFIMDLTSTSLLLPTDVTHNRANAVRKLIWTQAIQHAPPEWSTRLMEETEGWLASVTAAALDDRNPIDNMRATIAVIAQTGDAPTVEADIRRALETLAAQLADERAALFLYNTRHIAEHLVRLNVYLTRLDPLPWVPLLTPEIRDDFDLVMDRLVRSWDEQAAAAFEIPAYIPPAPSPPSTPPRTPRESSDPDRYEPAVTMPGSTIFYTDMDDDDRGSVEIVEEPPPKSNVQQMQVQIETAQRTGQVLEPSQPPKLVGAEEEEDEKHKLLQILCSKETGFVKNELKGLGNATGMFKNYRLLPIYQSGTYDTIVREYIEMRRIISIVRPRQLRMSALPRLISIANIDNFTAMLGYMIKLANEGFADSVFVDDLYEFFKTMDKDVVAHKTEVDKEVRLWQERQSGYMKTGDRFEAFGRLAAAMDDWVAATGRQLPHLQTLFRQLALA